MNRYATDELDDIYGRNGYSIIDGDLRWAGYDDSNDDWDDDDDDQEAYL